MIINLRDSSNLKGQTLSLSHTYELPHLVKRNKQLVSITPIQFQGQGKMEAGLFVVEGELKGEYTLACSRCLEDVHYPFEHRFEEKFALSQHHVQQSDKELGDEWEDIHPVTGQEIDLQPYIEEEILMSIPFIPVCASEEQCSLNQLVEGKDWTVLTDEIKRNKVDPRLADLAKLLDQNKE